MILVGLFAIPFLAFFVSKSMLFPFISGKNFGFRIITEIIFVLWAILAIKDAEYMPKKSWVLYSFMLFIGFLGLANLFGENPNKAFWSNFERMEGFITSIHLFLYFLVLSSVAFVKKTWDQLLGTWIGVSVVMCIFGLVQLAGLAVINQGGARVDGTFGNAIYLAVFLMFTFFFTAFFMVRFLGGKKSLAWFLVPIGVLQFVILYYTATRGALLGLLGGLFTATVIIAIGEKQNKFIKKMAIGSLAFLFLIVGGFWAIKDTGFVKESPVLARFSEISLSEIKTQGRYFIWPMAIKGIGERPLLGWGQEGFSYIFNTNYNPLMYAHEQWFDRAHNTLLDWLVAGGLLTFIPYMALFVFSLFYLWKHDNFNFSFAEKAVLTGLVAGYFFQSIFVFDNLFSSILLVSVLALAHANSQKERMTLPGSLKIPSVQNAISLVLICILVTTLYFWNVKPIQAGRNLIKGMSAVQQGNMDSSLDYFEKVFSSGTFAVSEAREQFISIAGRYLSQDVPEDIRVRYASLARQEAERHVKKYPNDARGRVFYGNLLRSMGLNDQALEQYGKALELSPNKQTFLFEIGSSLINKGEYQMAYEVLEQAYELAPDFYQAQVIYLFGALYAGDNAKVVELLGTINNDELIFDERLVSVLADLERFEDLVALFEARLLTERGAGVLQNFISLSSVYVEMGQYQKAIDLLRGVADKNPEVRTQMEGYIEEINMIRGR